MLRLIANRLLVALPVMAVVVTIVFLLLRISPGDPALIMAGDQATPEVLASIRAEMGLDRPIPVQYLAWIGDLLQGDLGRSAISKTPVTRLIASRIEPTLVLALCALCLTVAIAVPLGTIAAWRQNTLVDRTIMGVTVAGLSVPAFVIAYLLILWFSLDLRLFPVQGYVSPFDDLPRAARHLVLPSVTLALVYSALITRVTRASVLETLDEDFVRTARAKGGGEARILLRHVLPNAAVPIITVVGLSVAALVTGVVVTESVFNIPGIGRLMVDSILSRDYPIVQGLMLVFALLYVLVNLAVDVLYVVANPRIRY
ncbi:MAG: ABC transporter permease [Rhodobacteraceae bacterium]|nr:ABC transporter permease [Paracoccaceae bacterium]